MDQELATNRDVWKKMFQWIRSYGGERKYPQEALVIWAFGHGRTDDPAPKVLDIGCGWCPGLPVFMDLDFEYCGIDVVDDAFPSGDMLDRQGWSSRVNTQVFEPPVLPFPDTHFSHVISTEALHLNPSEESMRTVIAEAHRVLRPGGRIFVTLMHPEYWYMPTGGASWVGPNTIEVNDTHVEKNRAGARYFVFQNETEIKDYFSAFSDVYIGHEHRVFGERPEKMIYHWIVSATK